MNPKVVTILQARLGSTRLPGKVLLPLGSSTVLGEMIQRVRAAQTVGTVVVATTTSPEDLPIVQACEFLQTPVFRGHPTDCLDRHVQAGRAFQADIVVKIPSDCPLIDPRVIDTVLGFALANWDAYDYVSNLHPQSYPDGNDVEVMQSSALEVAWKEAKRPIEREHTTTFLWENPERFRLGNVVRQGRDLSQAFRCVLDYREDYELISKVYAALFAQNPTFGYEQVVDFLENHPEVRSLNQKYLGDSWYLRHKHELRTFQSEKLVP